tara:strand:- start:586 stop:2490 length:1905 start_codon:yes stop_codon:yes gene_type:complete
MAKPIDELIIQIKADTKQLQKELDQIKGKVRATGTAGSAAFGAGAGGLAGNMSKATKGAVALGAALVTTGLVVSKIAQIGVVFEDLSDSLNTVFGSIEAGDKAMSRVFEFAQKTPFQIETATKAFIALKSAGIEPSNRMLQVFADTASTSTDQLGVFEALVRTVQRSASGGLGLEELNMIMDRGIDVLGILNDELGLTKNEIADFGATAEGAKLITDALIEGLDRKFGGAMESKMDNLSTKASNMTIALKQLANTIYEGGLDQTLKDMADNVTRFAAGVEASIKASRGIGVGIALTGNIHEDIPALQARREELERLERHQRGLTQVTELDSNTRAQAALDADNYALQLANVNTELRRLGREEVKRMQAFRDGTDVDTESLMIKGKLARASSLLQSEIQKLEGDTDLLAFAGENLNRIFEDNKKTFMKLGIEDAPALGVALREIKEAAGEVAETFNDELKQAVQNQSLAFTTDFVNALMEGENALNSFKNFAQNMVSQIVATFLQLTVVNTILNSIFGQGTFSTLDINSGEITKGKLAGGGRIQAGKPTLVGERGAELFIPDSSGVVMNNMNTQNALGGGQPIVVNQSLNFATGVVPTVRAEVTKMLPQIADVTKGAVLESAMRGGAYARGLRRG